MLSRVLVAWALLLGSLAAEPLTLAQAQQRAVERHPALGRARARLEEARHKVREAEAGGNPRLDFQARYLFVTPELGFSTPQGSLPLVVNHNYQAGVVLEQALATFGRVHWARQAAELQVQSLQEDWRREQQRVAYLVAIGYSRLQTADHSIAVVEQSLKARERLLQDLAVREKAGVSAHYETLVAEVDRARDQQRLAQARQQRQLALSQLQSWLELPRESELELEPLPEVQLEIPPLNELLDQALLDRPELRAIEVGLQAAEARVALEESQSNPLLALQTRFDGRNSTAFQTGHQWSVGLDFRWPLFDGGLSSARADQARAARTQLSEGRREIERMVRLEVEEAVLRCGTAAQTLALSRTALKSAQEAHRLAELRFRAGGGTHQEVLDGQARLREAQQGVFEALQSLREAHWSLELALGK